MEVPQNDGGKKTQEFTIKNVPLKEVGEKFKSLCSVVDSQMFASDGTEIVLACDQNGDWKVESASCNLAVQQEL